MTTPAERDWGAWSQEAVRLMQERNDAFVRDYGLQGSRYKWRLDGAEMTFHSDRLEVVANLCLIGTLSKAEDSFLWAWANETIPAEAQRNIEKVRAFGEDHGLELLTTPEWRGGHAEALEVAAIAGRILDATSIWIEQDADITLFFALSDLQSHPSGAIRPGANASS